MDQASLHHLILESPVGPLTLIASEGHLTAISFGRSENLPPEGKSHPVLNATAQQLEEYFAGERQIFELPLDARGTSFQESVWAALSRIPFSETRSYQDIAVEIQNPKSVRAVGLANGRNPISIVIPCHRVIGKSGKLVGFGGGLPTKKWLLEFEAGQLKLPAAA